MAEKQIGEVYLKGVRLSFPHLTEKHKATEDSKLKFGSTFLIDPETKLGKQNIKNIEAAIEAAKEKAFKGQKVRFKEGRICYRDGDDCVSGTSGEVYDGYEGMKVVSASAEQMPTLLHRNKKRVDPENSPFYGGCFVEAIVRFYGTSKGGGPGIFATLEAVRFWEDGDHFGSAPVSADAFDDDDDDGFEDDDADDDMLG